MVIVLIRSHMHLYLKGHSGEVRCISFAPDGRALISGGAEDRTVRTWDLSSGQCSSVLKVSACVNAEPYNGSFTQCISQSSDVRGTLF